MSFLGGGSINCVEHEKDKDGIDDGSFVCVKDDKDLDDGSFRCGGGSFGCVEDEAIVEDDFSCRKSFSTT